MKRIGITGPTGAGKSTALQSMEALGIRIVDCDAVYHSLLERSAELRGDLTKRFGTGILDELGNIDRKRLGGVVYQDADAMADLDAIAHRYVLEELDCIETQALREGRPAVAYDAIALIESGLSARCNAVVGVLAPVETRIGRIMIRDGISEEYARMRVSAQKDEGFFRAHCTHILENNGDETQLAFQAGAKRLFTDILNDPL